MQKTATHYFPIETGNAFLLTFDLLINVQATQSEFLGTHYIHSQAYFKTWMDIITVFLLQNIIL